jgi:hypothetical protein
MSGYVSIEKGSCLYMDEEVNHPPHYTQGDIECIQGIEAALGPLGAYNYCKGAAIKYLWRCDYKGNTKTDLEKASWYIARAIENLEKM